MFVRVIHQRQGGHIHARVFTGRNQAQTLALSGKLVFREDEWDDAVQVLFGDVDLVCDDQPCDGPGYAHRPHGRCPGYVYDRT